MFIVSGRVQGVGYRWFAKDKAEKFGLTGTVKNLHDGRVEVYAQGEIDSIVKFRDKLKQGPSFARVDTVVESKINLKHEYKEFKVIF